MLMEWRLTKENIMITIMIIITMISLIIVAEGAGDTNDVFNPCEDAKVQQSDGFTFGIALSPKDLFFHNNVQLSPCDSRLSLSSQNAQLAIFRPKVDGISILTINSSSEWGSTELYMVAFAGRKYAARSLPIKVSKDNMVVTSFTLVLDFQKGTLQSLYWKTSGCESCPKESTCFDSQNCAMPISKCKGDGGSTACKLGIQLTFSGTDKNFETLNSWYEVANLRKYSIYALFSNLQNSFLGPLQEYL